MRTYGYARWVAIFACAMTVACLAACSKQHALEEKRQAAQTVATMQNLSKMKRLLALKTQLKQANDQSSKDDKQIPVLLSQSDRALKQAQKLQTQAVQIKNTKARKTIETKAKQAQDLADTKAQQLVALRQDYYTQLATAADLQKQIKSLTAEDKTASQAAVSKDDSAGNAGKSKRPSKIAKKSGKSNM